MVATGRQGVLLLVDRGLDLFDIGRFRPGVCNIAVDPQSRILNDIQQKGVGIKLLYSKNGLWKLGKELTECSCDKPYPRSVMGRIIDTIFRRTDQAPPDSRL